MTTTVKIHVNGKYRATVKQDQNDPVIVLGNGVPGESGERSFYLSHPADSTFVVVEEAIPDEPAADPGEKAE
jgi:hypothetical protein